MPYGERRLSKQPGEFGFVDYFGFASAGAVGVIAAIVVDMTQSADTSTLFLLSRWVDALTSMIGLANLPLYGVILLLMGLGAMSIFYFQPVTLQGAFLQGFGVLAAVMTVAPADLKQPLDPQMMDETPTEDVVLLEPQARLVAHVGSFGGVSFGDGSVQQALYQPAATSLTTTATALARQERAQRYNLVIEIEFPDGLRQSFQQMVRSGRLRGRLHNKTTGETYSLFLSDTTMSRDGKKLTIRTSVDGVDETAELYARVEAVGYAINVEQFDARLGNNPTWRIVMTPSSTPMFLQRLNNSYWF